jgi:hypothetical protein
MQNKYTCMSASMVPPFQSAKYVVQHGTQPITALTVPIFGGVHIRRITIRIVHDIKRYHLEPTFRSVFDICKTKLAQIRPPTQMKTQKTSTSVTSVSQLGQPKTSRVVILQKHLIFSVSTACLCFPRTL